MILPTRCRYAVEQKPDAIIDLATLTGACVVALGHDASGLFGNDDALAETVLQPPGDTPGERVWPLPLWNEYNEQIKSDYRRHQEHRRPRRRAPSPRPGSWPTSWTARPWAAPRHRGHRLDRGPLGRHAALSARRTWPPASASACWSTSRACGPRRRGDIGCRSVADMDAPYPSRLPLRGARNLPLGAILLPLPAGEGLG